MSVRLNVPLWVVVKPDGSVVDGDWFFRTSEHAAELMGRYPEACVGARIVRAVLSECEDDQSEEVPGA